MLDPIEGALRWHVDELYDEDISDLVEHDYSNDGSSLFVVAGCEFFGPWPNNAAVQTFIDTRNTRGGGFDVPPQVVQGAHAAMVTAIAQCEDEKKRHRGGGKRYPVKKIRGRSPTRSNSNRRNSQYRSRRQHRAPVPDHRSDLPPLCDNLFVDVWEERDRLWIAVKYVGSEEVVVAWWDDDARQMFEDGFFDSRDLEGSVLAYVGEMGRCRPQRCEWPGDDGDPCAPDNSCPSCTPYDHPPRHNLQPDFLPYREHAYYRENAYRPNPMRFNTDAPRPTLTTASVFLRWLRRSQEAKMLDAEIDWDESGNRAKVRFKDGTQIVVRGGKD